MYKEISKLIMYGNLDNNSILSSMADIFNRFDNNLSSKEELITDIYTQIKRILEVATDYGFDNNLWHNYLTYFLITNENPFSITCEKVGANDGSVNIFARNDFKVFYNLFHYDFSEIEEKLGIKAYDIYGLSEIAGPGVGYECECQNGTHLNEDHFFPEIIDPHTLQPVEPGQTGELVFTHLTKEGMPLLRYRTKDLTALHYEKCSCGRTLVRMDRILGRSDDMLIIRGVNVFPTQIESVILEMAEFEPHYLLTIDRKNNTDTMELKVEVRPDYYSDEINKMLALKKKLTGRLQSVLGLGVDVKLVEPRSIERSVGKAKRVIDNRKL